MSLRPSTPDCVDNGEDRSCKSLYLGRVRLTRMFGRLVALPEHRKHTRPGLADSSTPVCVICRLVCSVDVCPRVTVLVKLRGLRLLEMARRPLSHLTRGLVSQHRPCKSCVARAALNTLAPIQADDGDGDALLLESDAPEARRALTTRVGVVGGFTPLIPHALALPNLLAKMQLMWYCEWTRCQVISGLLF